MKISQVSKIRKFILVLGGYIYISLENTRVEDFRVLYNKTSHTAINIRLDLFKTLASLIYRHLITFLK